MKKITLIFSISALILILAYDVIAIYLGGTESSISALIIKASYEMPAFTFLSGFTMGHLFWRMRSNSMTDKIDKKE
jgi:hypothetical protein